MIASAMEKAEVLVSPALYQGFLRQKVVIKYGGAAMTDCNLKQKVMQDIVLMHYVGMHPIVVHGGGPNQPPVESFAYTSEFVMVCALLMPIPWK